MSNLEFRISRVFNPLEQFTILPGFPDSDSELWYQYITDSLFVTESIDFITDLFFDIAPHGHPLSIFFVTSVVFRAFFQYSIVPSSSSGYSGLSLSILWYLIPFFLVVLFFVFSSLRSTQRVEPLHWLRVAADQVKLVEDLIKENVGRLHAQYLKHLWIVFTLILFANLFGMIPFFFTVTSHIAVTFFLSSAFFISLNLIAVRRYGLAFFNLFIPAGAPAGIRPIFVFIEMISYFARAFSLAIRLFANMTAGHTLLKILIGYVFLMFVLIGVWIFTGFVSVLLVGAIVLLELFIAFLQAYVFTMLICIYLNDVLSLLAH